MEVKERPIIFSGDMVRAILDGRKSMTRRVLNPQPNDVKGWKCAGIQDDSVKYCPHGQPGDRLWVRETFQYVSCDDGPFESRDKGMYFPNDEERFRIEYLSTMGPVIEWDPPNFRPSIHMPRWASRITLEVTGVRVERVQDITEDDAKAEGVAMGYEALKIEIPENASMEMIERYSNPPLVESHQIGFKKLWNSINDKRGYGWDKSPQVWVVEFKRICGTNS